MANTATLMSQDVVIWKQGFSESFFGVTVSASIAVLVSDGNLYIEIELLGQRSRYNLCQTSYALEFGVGRFKVGIDNIEMSGTQLIAFCVKGELCIGLSLPYPIGDQEKCWTVVNQRIQVAAVPLAFAIGTGGRADRFKDAVVYVTFATPL